MQLEAFILCDAATDNHGKLNVLGAFDSVWATQLPVGLPHCSVALRLRFENSEVGAHPFRITAIDQDGQEIGIKIDGSIDVRAAHGTSSQAINLVVGLINAKFPRYGEFHLDLVIDGKLSARLPVFVRPPAAQKAA